MIPSLLLKQLYTRGSLQNTDEGIQFSLKNRLKDSDITSFSELKIGDETIPLESIHIADNDGTIRQPSQISEDQPLPFPLRRNLLITAKRGKLAEDKYPIEISVETSSFGKLKVKVVDGISKPDTTTIKIPRDNNDDYQEDIIKKRQKFAEEFTNKKLEHIPRYSFDPHVTAGNIEHFMGVAQVPLGIAGPITVHGEHANGDFLVPLATAEGTLVGSYNRGIKAVNLSGGATSTVSYDAMQRAPVFVFQNAKAAREFVKWVKENFDQIAAEAKSTTHVGKLLYIDDYLANKFAFLRFNYFTGDAAGQNMVGRATFAACSWILDHYQDYEITNFYLESNLATDKKASQINLMRTRGKRVTAEAVLKRDVLTNVMRVEPEQLAYHYGVANVGAILSGANNNGLHSANAITALFIATGQDVANVSESSAGIFYCEVTKEGDLYCSITIPSLIVATFGGGTNLATQKECLDLMGCVGKGKVKKLAEIIAAVVLAGEISLASAISSSDWVSSHEEYGRNR